MALVNKFEAAVALTAAQVNIPSATVHTVRTYTAVGRACYSVCTLIVATITGGASPSCSRGSLQRHPEGTPFSSLKNQYIAGENELGSTFFQQTKQNNVSTRLSSQRLT